MKWNLTLCYLGIVHAFFACENWKLEDDRIGWDKKLKRWIFIKFIMSFYLFDEEVHSE